MNWSWVQTGMFVSSIGFLGCAAFLVFMVRESDSWVAEDSANFVRLLQLTFFLFLSMCYFGDVGNIVPFQGQS